jgi:hypothetical protein
MTKRFLPFLLLAITAIVWASCNKTKDSYYYSGDETRGFFPIGLGRSVTYDVDSITWSDFNCTKTTRHLEMQYTVADTFTDNAGRPSYRIDVQQRDNVDSNWKTSQVFYVTPTNTSLLVTMQNLRMEKLIFPVREGVTWYGNKGIDTTDPSLRQYSGWVYRYSNYLQPYNNGRIDFSNTVTVTAINDSLNNPETMPGAYAERNVFREVYAYDIGMVYREATYWTYDPGDPATACRKGTSVVMRATQYR